MSRRVARIVVLAASLALVLVAGCADDASFTRITFAVAASGLPRDVGTPLVVTTPLGWEVTFEQARIGLGPVYFRNAPPAMGTGADSGRVTSQILSLFSVDALDPTPRPVSPGGVGTDEHVGQAEVRLTELEDGRSLVALAGTARRGTDTLRFDGSYSLAAPGEGEELAWLTARRIRRIPVELTPTDGAALKLVVDPSHWLDSIDFATLPSRDDGARDFTSDAALSQLRSGISRVDAYSFTPASTP